MFYLFHREIILKKKQIKEAFNYFSTKDVEAVSFPLLPAILQKGELIATHHDHKNRNNVNTYTFAGKVNINGKSAIMAVVVKETDGKRYKVHRILTPEGKVFEILDKKKEPTLASGGVTNNGSLAQNIGSISNLSVPRTDENSSTTSSRKSISVDTNGRSLSEGQQEYFADSKVVDENGNLMVVYHGSPNEFTEFKHEFIGSTGAAEGKGFYFTNNRSMAEGYSRSNDLHVLEGYLDIKKPLSLEPYN